MACVVQRMCFPVPLETNDKAPIPGIGVPDSELSYSRRQHLSRCLCEARAISGAAHFAWSDDSVAGAFFYESGFAIDADGSPRAYHPTDRLGLDSLSHAGHRGNWWALVTDSKTKNGTPVLQGAADPAPGYFVSTTALFDRTNTNPRDPRRYVDAEKIPYVVLHPKALRYARLGDFATVLNLKNRKVSAAIVADESAANLPVGEGSIALAEALGIDSSPQRLSRNSFAEGTPESVAHSAEGGPHSRSRLNLVRGRLTVPNNESRCNQLKLGHPPGHAVSRHIEYAHGVYLKGGQCYSDSV